MRNTHKASLPELSETAARDLYESVLLAVLNLGKDRSVAHGEVLIEYEKSVRPQNWTTDVQARIIALCRLAISTIERLRSLPPWRNGSEAMLREQMAKPLNDAFAGCLMTPRFQVDLVNGGQSLLVDEALSANSKLNSPEGIAMLGLRNLMKRGEIENLRECKIPSCKVWFIAKRQDQKWCSGTCRQAMYQSTETFKEQRRKNYVTKKLQLAEKLLASKRKKGKKDYAKAK